MPKPNEVLSDLLKSAPKAPKSKSVMEQKPELVEAITLFLDMKQAKDASAHVSLRWLYVEGGLREKYDGPSWDAARRYIRDVLRRDVLTGADL